MATLEQATKMDTTGFARADQGQYLPPATDPSLFPLRSAIRICPLPYLPGTFPSTNSIINYSFGGKIPQSRAPLPAQSVSGGGTSTTTVVSSSSSSSSSSTNNPPVSQIASISSPVLNPGNQFQGGILMAKSFYLIQLTVNGPARVRLYSTQAAQSADISRSLTAPVGLGTGQGIISDVEMDGAGTWQYVDTVGSNGNSPQSNLVYITIDNIGLASETVVASLLYVPLQS